VPEPEPDSLEAARLILARQRAEGVPFGRAWVTVFAELQPIPGYPVVVVERGYALG